MEGVIEEYRRSLQELSVNSKPLIDMLTILAQENNQYADRIVSLIETRLLEVRAKKKLLIFYLIDSIIKNVGAAYKTQFSSNLVNNFKQTFQESDDNVKTHLFKLRNTWDTHIDQAILHELDVVINSLDPNWPVRQASSQLIDNSKPKIYINPKFWDKSKTKEPVSTSSVSKTVNSNDSNVIETIIKQKEHELLELRRDKLLREMDKMKQQLDELSGNISVNSDSKIQETLSTDEKPPIQGTTSSSEPQPTVKKLKTIRHPVIGTNPTDGDVISSRSHPPKQVQATNNKLKASTSQQFHAKTNSNKIHKNSAIKREVKGVKRERTVTPPQAKDPRLARKPVVDLVATSNQDSSSPGSSNGEEARFSPQPDDDVIVDAKQLSERKRRRVVDVTTATPAVVINDAKRQQITKKADRLLRKGILSSSEHREVMRKLATRCSSSTSTDTNKIRPIRRRDETSMKPMRPYPYPKSTANNRVSRVPNAFPPSRPTNNRAIKNEVRRMNPPPPLVAKQLAARSDKISKKSLVKNKVLNGDVKDTMVARKPEEPEEFIIAEMESRNMNGGVAQQQQLAYEKHVRTLKRSTILTSKDNKHDDETAVAMETTTSSEPLKSPPLPLKKRYLVEDETGSQKLSPSSSDARNHDNHSAVVKNVEIAKRPDCDPQTDHDLNPKRPTDETHLKVGFNPRESKVAENSEDWRIESKIRWDQDRRRKRRVDEKGTSPPHPVMGIARGCLDDRKRNLQMYGGDRRGIRGRLHPRARERHYMDEAHKSRRRPPSPFHQPSNQLSEPPMTSSSMRFPSRRGHPHGSPDLIPHPTYPPDIEPPLRHHLDHPALRHHSEIPHHRRHDHPPRHHADLGRHSQHDVIASRHFDLPPHLRRLDHPLHRPDVIPPRLRHHPDHFHHPDLRHRDLGPLPPPRTDDVLHYHSVLPPSDETRRHPEMARRDIVIDESIEAKSAPISEPKPVDVHKLLQDLISKGMISNASSMTSSSRKSEETTAVKSNPMTSQSPDDSDSEVTDIPLITFESDLKIRRDDVIKRLYTGKQCNTCGSRYLSSNNDRFAQHLDWHFRLNRRGKDGSAALHQQFYSSATDWIHWENTEDAITSQPMECEQVDERVEEKKHQVALTGRPGEDKCRVCDESFNTFYNDNDEEWQFGNCITVEGLNFHPSCHGDHSSSPLLTPIKEQEPPMIKDTIEIKQEKEEENSSVVVKNEPVVDSPKIESEVDPSVTSDLLDSINIKQEPLSGHELPQNHQEDPITT